MATAKKSGGPPPATKSAPGRSLPAYRHAAGKTTGGPPKKAPPGRPAK